MRKYELNIAYASYDNKILSVAKKYFSECNAFKTVAMYNRGDHLLYDLECYNHVQVIILDEYLQDMDAFDFLKKYSLLTSKNKPIIIALCPRGYVQQTQLLQMAGAYYCIVKPFQMQELKEKIFFLYEGKTRKIPYNCDILYKRWNISQDVVNCSYLTEAVVFSSESKEKLALRKEILFRIALVNNTSVDAVNSGIRRLIKRAEENSTFDYLRFKRKSSIEGKKPTVGEFIHLIKECVENM